MTNLCLELDGQHPVGLRCGETLSSSDPNLGYFAAPLVDGQPCGAGRHVPPERPPKVSDQETSFQPP
jgi:hypothetical protein